MQAIFHLPFMRIQGFKPENFGYATSKRTLVRFNHEMAPRQQMQVEIAL